MKGKCCLISFKMSHTPIVWDLTGLLNNCSLSVIGDRMRDYPKRTYRNSCIVQCKENNLPHPLSWEVQSWYFDDFVIVYSATTHDNHLILMTEALYKYALLLGSISDWININFLLNKSVYNLTICLLFVEWFV